MRKDDLRTWNVIYSLNLTEKSALQPEIDKCNHLVGMLWKSYKGYSAAALKYIHACNLDVQNPNLPLLKTQNSTNPEKYFEEK